MNLHETVAGWPSKIYVDSRLFGIDTDIHSECHSLLPENDPDGGQMTSKNQCCVLSCLD